MDAQPGKSFINMFRDTASVIVERPRLLVEEKEQATRYATHGSQGHTLVARSVVDSDPLTGRRCKSLRALPEAS